MIESIRNDWKFKMIQYHSFVFVIILSLFFLDIRLTTFLTVILAWLKPEILYPLLIIVPAIKNVTILSQDFTMIKLLGILYLISLIYRKRFQKIYDMISNWHFSLLYFYILLILLSIVNFRLFSWEKISMVASLDLAAILKYNLFNIVKIIFSLFLFLDFANMEMGDLKKILNNMSTVITISVLPIFIYTMTFGFKSWESWRVIRGTLQNTEPGEYCYLLSILIPFLIYCLLYNRNMMLKILSITSLCGIIYLISMTVSRGGALTLLFAVMLSIFFLKENVKKALIFLIMVIVLMISLALTGLINIDYWIIRNRIMNTSISKLTSHRSDFLIAGLKYSVSSIKNFLLGGGGSPLLEKYINLTDNGKFHAMHNIYIGNLVKYGILGLTTIGLVMGRIIHRFVKCRAILIKTHQAIFLVPFLSLLISLFAGLFVPWDFREIVWILTGISAGIVTALDTCIKTNGEFATMNKE